MFWGSKKQEREDEKIAADYARVVENLANRRLLFRLLWVCIAGNIAVWLGVFLMPSFVYEIFTLIFDFSDKFGVSLLGFPFGFGLFAVYCLARLKFPDIEDNNLNSEMMASFSYQANSTKRWFIWLFSILAGVINVILLVSVTLLLNNQI